MNAMTDADEPTILGTPPLVAGSRVDYDQAFKRSLGQAQPGEPPVVKDTFDASAFAAAFTKGIQSALTSGADPYTHAFVPAAAAFAGALFPDVEPDA